MDSEDEITDENELFSYICENSDLANAQEVYNSHADLIKTETLYDHFIDACRNDQLSIAEWIYSLKKIKLDHIKQGWGSPECLICNTIVIACSRDHVDIVKFLHTAVPVCFKYILFDAFVMHCNETEYSPKIVDYLCSIDRSLFMYSIPYRFRHCTLNNLKKLDSEEGGYLGGREELIMCVQLRKYDKAQWLCDKGVRFVDN
jgi:hypothetical protein